MAQEQVDLCPSDATPGADLIISCQSCSELLVLVYHSLACVPCWTDLGFTTDRPPWRAQHPTRWQRPRGQQQRPSQGQQQRGPRSTHQRWQRSQQREPPSRRHRWRSRTRWRRRQHPQPRGASPPQPCPRPQSRGRGLKVLVSCAPGVDTTTDSEKHTEVEIDHDVPGGLAGVDGSTEAEDLTGEHPPDGTNGVATLVVGRDGNVDVLGGGVGVAKGDHGDVDVGSLLDGLGIGAGVGDDDQTGLLERTGDVVGEGTGGETTSDGLGTGVGGELEDGTLSVGTSGDDTDIGGVVDGGDDAGGEDNLLPVDRRRLVFFGSFAPQMSGLVRLRVAPEEVGSYQVLPTLMTLTPSALLRGMLAIEISSNNALHWGPS